MTDFFGTQLETENQAAKNYEADSRRLGWYLPVPIWNVKFHEQKPLQICSFESVKAAVNFSA